MDIYFLICLSDGGSMTELHHGWNISYKPPTIGFVISLTVLVACYRIVTHHHLSAELLPPTIAGLAVSQAIVQLIFFLHVGLDSKPRWKSITFIFTVFVIFLIVALTIWIMHHLDYNLMPKMEHP